jgi:hypothetical protein
MLARRLKRCQVDKYVSSQRPARDSTPYRLMSEYASCGTPGQMFRPHGQMCLTVMIFSKIPLAIVTTLHTPSFFRVSESA